VEPEGAGRSIIEPGDAIAIIPAHSADCLRDSLLQIHPTLRIVSPDDFRRAAFPDQPADDVAFAYPIRESQRKLLATPMFRDRVAPLRLRYLVSVGEQEESHQVGTPGDWDSGFTSWETSLTMRASVIDLKDGRAVESIEFHAAGDRGVFFLFGVPLFFVVEIVRGPVCKALGERLGNVLTRRDSTSGPSTSAPSGYARAAYERGNYATALWLFRRQAERGDADAQNNLATMYRAGQGVPQDYVQAYVWFTLAATRFPASEAEKRDKAIKDREEVAAKLTAEQVAEAQRLAHEWRPE
jgi:hypothetical protein